MDDHKSTTAIVFYMGDTTFKWVSNKKSIVILSRCEVEYPIATSCVCHAIVGK